MARKPDQVKIFFGNGYWDSEGTFWAAIELPSRDKKVWITIDELEQIGHLLKNQPTKAEIKMKVHETQRRQKLL